jgi:hypothetical protein
VTSILNLSCFVAQSASLKLRQRKAELGYSAGSPPPPANVMPDREEFDPAAYLAHFHHESSMELLLAGREHLESKLSRGHGQLKALVKENFGRFLRCVVMYTAATR